MQESSPTTVVAPPSSASVPEPNRAPKKSKRSAKKLASQPTQSESASNVAPSVTETLASTPVSTADSAQELAPSPRMVIQQLQKRLMNPDHSVHYQTRQKQLQTALEIMSQIARKIGKEDASQRAVLSGMYELMLVIAERFVLLTHGIMQLDAMNHASALPAIREARRKYKQVADLQSTRQAHLDVPSTLQLLSELSRASLD